MRLGGISTLRAFRKLQSSVRVCLPVRFCLSARLYLSLWVVRLLAVSVTLAQWEMPTSMIPQHTYKHLRVISAPTSALLENLRLALRVSSCFCAELLGHVGPLFGQHFHMCRIIHQASL